LKKLGFFGKGVFFINSIAATMLLLSYLLPYVAPKTFSILSVLSLAVPLLIILNILFVLYWLLKLKKQLLLSLIVLLIGYNYIGSLYKFSSSKNIHDDNNISVMNYNVRLFNLYDWIPKKNVESSIVDLINKEQPDILCLQEYHPHKNVILSQFKYKFENLDGERTKYGQAIFSNYPIVSQGSVDFPNTANNAIYADIVKDSDTIRIYNIHLQSSHINTDVDNLKNEDSERLLKTLRTTFVMQQDQAELFNRHRNRNPYKAIVTGDFNNTAYSYVYRLIKGDLKDTFQLSGNGFGRTFDFKFPVRIDFILVDESFQVNDFKNYDEKLSDHYPIMAKVILKK